MVVEQPRSRIEGGVNKHGTGPRSRHFQISTSLNTRIIMKSIYHIIFLIFFDPALLGFFLQHCCMPISAPFVLQLPIFDRVSHRQSTWHRPGAGTAACSRHLLQSYPCRILRRGQLTHSRTSSLARGRSKTRGRSPLRK